MASRPGLADTRGHVRFIQPRVGPNSGLLTWVCFQAAVPVWAGSVGHGLRRLDPSPRLGSLGPGRGMPDPGRTPVRHGGPQQRGETRPHTPPSGTRHYISIHAMRALLHTHARALVGRHVCCGGMTMTATVAICFELFWVEMREREREGGVVVGGWALVCYEPFALTVTQQCEV